MGSNLPLPLFTECLRPSGYIEMLVPERNPYTGAPTRWVRKHAWLWEQAHGKPPKGKVLIFADGNRLHCELDNLELVSRAEASRRIARGTYCDPALYAERIGQGGYLEIFVPVKSRWSSSECSWMRKHLWPWRQAHGEPPQGKVLIFSDGDRLHCEPENLEPVSRIVVSVLATHRFYQAPPELRPSILALAKLETAAGFRTRPIRGRQMCCRNGHSKTF